MPPRPRVKRNVYLKTRALFFILENNAMYGNDFEKYIYIFLIGHLNYG